MLLQIVSLTGSSRKHVSEKNLNFVVTLTNPKTSWGIVSIMLLYSAIYFYVLVLLSSQIFKQCFIDEDCWLNSYFDCQLLVFFII